MHGYEEEADDGGCMGQNIPWVWKGGNRPWYYGSDGIVLKRTRHYGYKGEPEKRTSMDAIITYLGYEEQAKNHAGTEQDA